MQGQKDNEERGKDRDKEEGGWHPSRDEGHVSCLRNWDVPNTLYVGGLVPRKNPPLLLMGSGVFVYATMGK